MYRIFIIAVLIIITFTACNNPLSSPTPTLTPTLTPTATPIPFSALQLDDLIVQPNDLPAGVSGAQIGYHEEKVATVPVAADYYIEQELAYKDNKRGEVQIWIYDDSANALLRYNNRLDLLNQECAKTVGQCHPGDPQAIPDLGEAAMMIDVYNSIGPDAYTISYYHCHAVVEVSIWAVTNDPNDVITYAQRLDKRLAPIVCR